MKLTIITVTYNAGMKLHETLNSILEQNINDYECIIQDGCSSDNTLAIAKSYRNKIPNLRIYSQVDKGVYDAMNMAVLKAKGSFVVFLNAGDIFIDKYVLQNIITFLDGDKVIYGDSYYLDSSGELLPYRVGRFGRYRLGYENICHQTIFYPKKALIKFPFNCKYRLFADYEVNVKLFKKYEFVHVSIPIVIYEGGGISATQKDIEFEKDLKRIVISNLGLDVAVYLLLRKLRRALRIYFS